MRSQLRKIDRKISALTPERRSILVLGASDTDPGEAQLVDVGLIIRRAALSTGPAEHGLPTFTGGAFKPWRPPRAREPGETGALLPYRLGSTAPQPGRDEPLPQQEAPRLSDEEYTRQRYLQDLARFRSFAPQRKEREYVHPRWRN